MENKKSQKILEYTTGFIEYTPEGYFFVRMKDNSVSTVATVLESHELMNGIQPEGPVYILADAGVGSSSEEEIYEFIATSEFGNRVKAQAVVVHELAARLLGNIFMRFIKNKRHIRIFSKHSEAKKWLVACMDDSIENQNDKHKRLITL